MTETVYNWKRYWVPREGSFSFDYQGFLIPPAQDAEWAKYWKTDVIGFEEMLSKPCLMLLGEPGIGKSFAIRDVEAQTRIARGKAKILPLNLSSYSNELRLIKDIFESPEFLSWRETGDELHIFLDSFDECLMRIDSVAELLAEQFTRLTSVQNLFLRIASRTAEWRIPLEDALRNRWGKEAVTVLELAPLTREQVMEAAKIELKDPEQFVEKVITSEVVSFAIKPLTLNLLFRIWEKRGGSLPPTQREIYEQGCLELCTDSEKRQTPKLKRTHSPEQLLAVASHIATATFFCNRVAVWTGSSHKSPAKDVSLSELSTSTVTCRGQHLNVTEAAVKEALNTGLFTARGPNRFGWAHQTYGEFLAACYLVQEKLTDRQILDLLTHPHDQKLIPQLQEIAAWATEPESALFEHLASVHPDVLLRSDVATADAGVKSALVVALIKAFANETIQRNWWSRHGDIRTRFRKLHHPNLSKQLRPYLLDCNVATGARVEVVAIIEACELTDLYPDLTNLAIDSNEVQYVRECAAGCISRSSDTKLKKQLRCLALGQAGEDPNNELRGAGLLACWPEYVTADELFSSLKKPDDRFAGLYHLFLSKELVTNLPDSAIPRALVWVESHHDEDKYPHSDFSEIITQILDRAADHMCDDTVLTQLAKTLLSLLRDCSLSRKRQPSHLANVLESFPGLRLKLAGTMVQLFKDTAREPMLMTGYGLRLLSINDIPWLIEQMEKSSSSELEIRFAHIIEWVFHPNHTGQIGIVVDAAHKNPALFKVISHLLNPIDIGSEEAQEARDRYRTNLKYQEEDAQSNKTKTLDPPSAERIIELLDKFESGDMDAWWHPYFWVAIDDKGHFCDNKHYVDIRELAAWKDSSGEIRSRIISAAEFYVKERGAKPEDWFSKRNILYYPAIGGFRALILLGNESPATFNALPRKVWEEWMPAILRLHSYNEREAHRWLAAKAFKYAPDTASAWTVKVINEENKEGEYLGVLSKLPDERDNSLQIALLQRAKKGRLKPRCFEELHEDLLKHHVQGALEFARTKVDRKALGNERGRQLALYAAKLLMVYGDRSDWARIWKLINGNVDFGKDLLEEFAHTYNHAPAGILKTLSETDVGQLWEWMLVQYPVADDPDRTGSGTVTLRHSIADLRNNFVVYLADIGTVTGCNELQRLIVKYPQFDWFRRVLLRGQEQMRRLTWQPTSPDQLFQLAANHRARLIQSGEQLLEVIIDSLNMLQEQLQGETPQARFLWDVKRPKPEEDISDWVKIHLEKDLKPRGVVLGREVQIHRYDKTDIHVTAVIKNPNEKAYGDVKVIIEVKGAWNIGLKTAMDTQLAERYLKDTDCQHGLYLVGWFNLVGWDSTDTRKKKVKFQSRDKMEDFLTQQADKLSSPLRSIKTHVLDFSVRQPASKARSSSQKNKKK